MPAQSNRARSGPRRRKDRHARAAYERDQRALARLAEVPELALDAIALYRLEVAKRREDGRPTLKSRDELRALMDDAARIA